MYRFEPPTRQLSVDPSGRDFLWSRVKYTQGDAVIKYTDGTYKTVSLVNPDEAGVEVRYLGGHVHTVSDAEAALLTAAGYGSYLTVVPA